MINIRAVMRKRLHISKFRRLFTTILKETKEEIPKQCRVVIVGGGVIGCSVAYHLSKLGWSDIVLLERAQLSSGTTWHAAGLIGQLRDTETETKLSGVYGTKLYSELEEETGLSTGFKRCGSLTLASCSERITQLQIRAAKARSFGIESELLSPKEACQKFPYLNIDDLYGALWLPGDGTATSSDVCQALAKGARMRGVKIVERCKVTGMLSNTNVSGSPIHTIQTSSGDIKCEIVVNCGGLWARQIGEMAGVSVPLASAEHFYIVSKPLTPRIDQMLPVMRDPDAYLYYREWSGGLLMGGFEPIAKPAFVNGPPDQFEFSLLPEDWDHFDILMKGALHRTPVLNTAEVRMINGPESFTPDNQYILGEAPERRKFYVAAGFNSSGIASAGGAGKALAEWIVNDEPTLDLWSVDIRRFHKIQNNSMYLSNRVGETLGLHYQIGWPRRELESCRGVRRSPFFPQLQGLNARFGSKFGWERANYFYNANVETFTGISSAPIDEGGSDCFKFHHAYDKPKYAFGKNTEWFNASKHEHLACRNSVAFFDITSFSKILVQGHDAMPFLNRLCVANMGRSCW